MAIHICLGQGTTETQKLAVKKKYLKKSKLFGSSFHKSLKKKLAMKKEGADSIGAAGPKGEDGGDLKSEMKKEDGSMVEMSQPPIIHGPMDSWK